MKKLIFLGDFFYSYDYVAEDIRDIAAWIRSQDAGVILNLEGPLAESTEKVTKRGPNLSQNLVCIEILKALNVIGVSLANNHIMDYGEKALVKTIEILKRNRIAYAGAGLNEIEANSPMIICLGDVEYAFFSYGWEVEETVIARKNKAGAASYDRQHIYWQIKNNKKTNREIVLLLHWGFENNLLPQPVDIQFAHNAIELGVKMIIGGHPHVIQPYEKYCGHNIYYSLGNFYFSSRRDKFTKQFFSNTPEENCYGLGVIWDWDSDDMDTFIIKYDRISKTSCICDKSIHTAFDLNSQDIFSFNYRLLLKKQKKNINPYLRMDNWYYNIKLKLFTIIVRGWARNLYLFFKTAVFKCKE